MGAIGRTPLPATLKGAVHRGADVAGDVIELEEHNGDGGHFLILYEKHVFTDKVDSSWGAGVYRFQ